MNDATIGVRGITRRVGTVLAGALVGALAALVVLLVFAAVFAKTDEHGVTRVAGHPVMTVLSDSMTPTFRAGDLLVEQPVGDRADRLAKGNVITFRAHEGVDELVTHRIIRVKTTPDGIAYRTQGDANNAADLTPVAPDQVVGVYSWRIPYGGYVLRAVQSQYGMFLLIFLPALLLLFPVLLKWWRATGEPKGDTDPGATDGQEHPALVPAGGRKGDSDQFET